MIYITSGFVNIQIVKSVHYCHYKAKIIFLAFQPRVANGGIGKKQNIVVKYHNCMYVCTRALLKSSIFILIQSSLNKYTSNPEVDRIL